MQFGADALFGLGVDGGLPLDAVLRMFFLLAFGQRTVLEADNQLAAVLGDEVVGQNKMPLLAVRFLDGVFLVVGRRYLESHALFAAADGENIRRIILGGLDVILVRVCPVQFDFLAVIRNRIGVFARAFVSAQRHKIAFVVVAGKEVAQMVVGVGLGLLVGFGGFDLGVQFLNFGGLLGVKTQFPCAFGRLFERIFEQGGVGLRDVAQRLGNLRQEVVFQKRADFGALVRHDAVQAEVQVTTVELKQLTQFRLEFREVFGDGLGGRHARIVAEMG